MPDTEFVEVDGMRIAYERAGAGFPLLLLHGWPQTRRMWRYVAPPLSARFTLVMADLPGYGDSEGSADAAAYDMRTRAETLLGLMDRLGLGARFLAAGHDRGARIIRRLAADQPDRLAGASLLDIMPLEWVYGRSMTEHRGRYFGLWNFLLLRGVAEELIGARPEAFARAFLGSAETEGRGPLDPDDVAHYVERFSRPTAIAATLADYRAAFEIDRPRWEAEVAAGKRIRVPLQILWGANGSLGNGPVLQEWRKRAIDVRGQAIAGSGHYLAEEQPAQIVRCLNAFADELGLP